MSELYKLFSFVISGIALNDYMITPAGTHRAITNEWCGFKRHYKIISHPTRAQHILSAARTVQVSHALPEVSFSCLLRGRGADIQDGVAVGEGFLCVPL
jgi:hypothetical protein